MNNVQLSQESLATVYYLFFNYSQPNAAEIERRLAVLPPPNRVAVFFEEARVPWSF